MRNILTTIIIIAALTVAAQNYSPCYKDKYAQGVELFNNNKYKEAKAKFVAAKECPVPNTTEADTWIGKCNKAIEEAEKVRQELEAYNRCTSLEKCDEYLNKYPNGAHAKEVKEKKQEFQAEKDALTLAERVESFVKQTESKGSKYNSSDWDKASATISLFLEEYQYLYNRLSIRDLDRVDDAIERYRKITQKYGVVSKKDDELKIIVDDIEYAYETPTKSQLSQWKRDYADVCSKKLQKTNHQRYTISELMREDDPCLVYLILKSKSLSEDDEKQNWLDLYVVMDEEQIDKLYYTLYRESYKLGLIDKCYGFRKEAINYAYSGDFYNAYLSIDKAIALAPNNPSYYESKGGYYLMQDRLDKALAMWNKVIELNPQYLDKKNGHSKLYDGLVEKGKIKTKK